MPKIGIDTPHCHCLDCGHEVDAASGLGNRGPKPNDITVCFYCGHTMAFKEDLTVRALTEDEMCMIAGNAEVIRIQKAIRDMRRREADG